MELHRDYSDDDGYSVVFNLGEVKTLVCRVTGDDSRTWKLQGTIDDINWYDVDDSAGAPTRQVHAPPIDFNVLKFTKGRITVNNPAGQTYIMHLKGLAV